MGRYPFFRKVIAEDHKLQFRKRHRRMFNKNLDERISRVVWTETLQQAQAMINHLVDHPGNETLEGLRSIAINVIGKAGYNWQQPWSPNELGIPPKSATSKEAYFGMLGLVTTMILEAALLPRKIMQLPFMPLALQSMGYHLERAPWYIQEILRNERESNSKKKHSESNFLSLMLQFSEEGNSGNETKPSLTKEEISGNLFVFTSAGFETTANSMGFAVILLALYPEWQDWVQHEIHGLDIGGSDWTYENTFPKCKRTLALMVWDSSIFSDRSECTDIDGIDHSSKPYDCILQWDIPPVPSSTPLQSQGRMDILIVSHHPWISTLSSP